MLVFCCILTLAGIATLNRITVHASHIRWTPCPSTYPASLECGRLAVPVDYNHPNRAQISLGMVRLRASTPRALGNLIVNPGGPGNSAVSVLARQKQRQLVSRNLTLHYNIIAPDPRGVGASHPVRCDADVASRRVPGYITSIDDFDKLATWSEALGKSCARMTGPVFYHLDTISAARDLDRIRRALGDEKLNYMGVSYGTQLGGQYAELFPEHVGRMVLDGVLDHSQAGIDSLMTESMAAEDSFHRFTRWCNTTSKCAFYSRDLPSIFDKLVDMANEKPIPALGCHEGVVKACRPDVTGYELISQAQEDLSDPKEWARLSRALHEASEGNATLLSPRLTPPNESLMPSNYNSLAHTAISCLDWRHRAGPRAGNDMLARLMAARALAPHTRGINEMLEIQINCIAWPAPVTNPERPLSRERLARAPPILLANSLHDPSTSVVWAVGLREQMPTAVSIFRDGGGHTSYWDYGHVQKAMDAFLLNGTMPEDLAVYRS